MADYNSIEEVFAAGIKNMTIIRDGIKQDDGTDTVEGASWFVFNGAVASNVYVSGNSFMGLGTNAENLTVNRRDAAMWYLYREEGTLYNYYRFLKIRWRGYTSYSATGEAALLEYDVILWENGCISLHMITVPTENYTGTFALTAASALNYTKPTADNPDVTFTPKDKNNTAFAVEYTMLDLVPPYDRKYLIRSGATIYTVTGNALTALTQTEVTASLFREYGSDDLPDGALLAGLIDPEVLYWQDSEDKLPKIKLTIKGTPPLPQMFTSDPMDLTHESIAGIDHVVVDASEDVRFAISFDGGTTWKAYDGSAWFDTSETVPGMLTSTLNAITAEQWAEVVVMGSYMLRFWLPNITAYVDSVVIHYVNP